ncbi:hypothetical protein ACJX0J_040096, partial [Zea mays]
GVVVNNKELDLYINLFLYLTFYKTRTKEKQICLFVLEQLRHMTKISPCFSKTTFSKKKGNIIDVRFTRMLEVLYDSMLEVSLGFCYRLYHGFGFALSMLEVTLNLAYVHMFYIENWILSDLCQVFHGWN